MKPEQDAHAVHPARELSDRNRVLKYGDTFAVFDEYGDAQFDAHSGSAGLYHANTRFLSRERLQVGGVRPLLLGSTITDDNTLLAVDMANAELCDERGEVSLPADTLHLFRSKFLSDGTCFERLRVKNHGLEPVRVEVAFEVAADFADIFEIRGERRARRGNALPSRREGDELTMRYVGLDEVERRTRLRWEPAAAAVDGAHLRFEIALAPGEETAIHLELRCETGERPPSDVGRGYDASYLAVRDELLGRRDRGCAVSTSNELFNRWILRSRVDVAMMTTETPYGPYPYAGVPWFNTVFGRDGLITALEMLWVDPSLARGVLRYLAATQATRVDDVEDAEPGKIVHELREGEMARLREVPFARYYGTIDATPLFLVLAGEYWRRTADMALIDELWPSLDAALRWIDDFGDRDGDGFVEYARHCEDGLVQQGWKDANDSVFHADGELAPGPIALAEVQGYVYAGLLAMSELAEARDERERAGDLRARAERLREAFEQRFWCDALDTYAIALDGAKRPCEVRASNAGHCLFTGIVDRERARRTARTLLSPAMFSGWGVRTVADGTRRYNPMAYHNGSVWPHDNAVVAAGIARYGFKHEAARILAAMFDVSMTVELHRMPELLCGFVRRPGQGPTLYPVACAPQAWAAGAVFMMLQACLGLRVRATLRELEFDTPVLPDFLDWVRLRGLLVAGGVVDLVVRRAGRDVTVEVISNETNVDVIIHKRAS